MKILFVLMLMFVTSFAYALPESYRCEVEMAISNDAETTEKLLDKYLDERFIVKTMTGQVISNHDGGGLGKFDLPYTMDVLNIGVDNTAWQGESGDMFLQINEYVDKLLVPFTFVLKDDKEISGHCIRSFI